MRTYQLTLTLVLAFAYLIEPAHSQAPEESLEARLNLKPLPAINLIDTTQTPPIGIWRVQKPVFFRAIQSKQWVWQPPIPNAPLKPRRRARNRQPEESLLPDKPIDPAIQFDKVNALTEIPRVLSDRFLDSQSEVLFHARIDSPNGVLLLGTTRSAPKLVGRQNAGGVLVDQYVTKFAQLKLYEEHPDHLELRLFQRVLQREVLPPGTRAGQKPREFTQIQQVCPTLILESKSIKESQTADAVAQAMDEPADTEAPIEIVAIPGMKQAPQSEPAGIENSPTLKKDYRPTSSEVVRFKNRGDHISFDKSIELGTDFTIEAIVKMDRPIPSMTVVNADGTVLLVDARLDPPDLESYNPNRLRVLVPIQIGVWHHIAMVRSGTQWQFFANGEPTGERNDARAITDKGQLVISRADGKQPFLGDLREVRISNSVRYEQPFVPPTEMDHDPHTLVLLKAEDVQEDRWPDRGDGDYVGVLHGAQAAVLASPNDFIP